MRISRRFVALAVAGASFALAGCGSLTGNGCASRSGPEPRRAADAYVRDFVVGGRKAAAKHFASFATFAYDRLPAPVPGQDVKRVLASGERSTSTSCAILQLFGAEKEIDPCFYYTLRTEDDRAPPYDFFVPLSCEGGRWRVSGGPGRAR
jgi:hypothetical protein